MRFFVRNGAKFPSCYGDPQDFLDALALAMDFQDAQSTPLFYNGHLYQNSTGFGPPKVGSTYYGDAIWWDPRNGGSLHLDGNFTFAVREQLASKGYRRHFGRDFGDIVPFVYKTTGSSLMPDPSASYYFPNDVACIYNGYSRKIAVTTNEETPVTYNIIVRPWVFCDGYHYGRHPNQVQQSIRIGQVPNLIGRMIVGQGTTSADGGLFGDERMPTLLKGTSSSNSIGGSMSAKIDQVNMLPNHRHNFVDKNGYTSVATSSAATGTGYTFVNEITPVSAYATDTTGAKSGTNNDQAWPFVNEVKPHQNMPPYYVVGYKMYVGYSD